MAILARLLILLIAIPALAAQHGKNTATGAVLARLAAAKKVFISNLGEDTIEAWFFTGSTDLVDQPYNYLYSAMQNWGQYQLVLVPADADLVFEARYSDDIFYDYPSKLTKPPNPVYQPQLSLTIRDPATGSVIQEFTEEIKWANLPSNREKNFAQATVDLLNDIARALGRPMTTFTFPKKIPQGPVPAQILAARTVFIAKPAEDKVHGDPARGERLYEQVVAATKTWGQLEIAASAQDADIIWQPSVYDGDLRMTITDPRTKILLWGLSEEVNRTLLGTEPQKNIDLATVSLLNQASQVAGKVAFGAGPAPDKILSPSAPLPVMISAPATAKAGSDVQVHVILKNTTSADLDFEYSDGDPLTCIVAVRDANGNTVADTAQGSKLKAEHTAAKGQGKQVSYAIHPGETQTRDCAVSALYEMSAPGKYSIQVQELDGRAVESNVVSAMIAR